jgi:hypothetical protein
MGNAHGILLDCERLKCALSQNQLVQANAFTQKIEKVLQDDILAESSSTAPAESHRYWKAWRNSHVTKNFIMGGHTREALSHAEALFDNIKGVISKEGI